MRACAPGVQPMTAVGQCILTRESLPDLILLCVKAIHALPRGGQERGGSDRPAEGCPT